MHPPAQPVFFDFQPAPDARYKFDYEKIAAEMEKARQMGALGEVRRHLRYWGREDLFFLLYFILGIKQVNHPWVVDRITEVEEINDRTIDLWAREHYKSTIITWALNIQAVIRNPEERIGIFSHTRSLAKSHLRRIKQTLETNRLLVGTFDEIFWEKPQNQAPKWSEDDGLIVKRRGTYLESTFEAWGVVDGMPTGKHFTVLNYDDVVTVESVSTPEQMLKVRECFGLSLNLGVRDGKKRMIGTRYHFNDLYATCKDQGLWIVRERPAEDPETGEPVLMTEEELRERYTAQGPYNYNSQMLLNPVADELQEFKGEWVRWYNNLPSPLNVFILVDPAHSKKKGSDFTVMAVVGIDRLGNHYLIDMRRKRMNLRERWEALRDLIIRYPQTQKVGYEQYGLQADIQYIEQMQEEEGIRFNIRPLGGRVGKAERIRRLVPLFSSGKFFLPRNPIMEGDQNLVQAFLEEEYALFPFSRHDDMLDAIARICDEDFNALKPIMAPEEGRRLRRRRVSGVSNWAI